jgi:hypothetical protein
MMERRGVDTLSFTSPTKAAGAEQHLTLAFSGHFWYTLLQQFSEPASCQLTPRHLRLLSCRSGLCSNDDSSVMAGNGC